MSEKKGINASMLSGARAAEESLARSSTRDMEEQIPEGHPLREAADSRREGGDLDGLPPGHPLRVAMEAAAENYHRQQAEMEKESDDAQDKTRTVRKAKKLDRQKAQRERIDHEEKVRNECQRAAKVVNKGIDDSLGSIRELYKVMAAGEEVLGQSPYCAMRVSKLKRLLQAVERGLFDCRMTRV